MQTFLNNPWKFFAILRLNFFMPQVCFIEQLNGFKLLNGSSLSQAEKNSERSQSLVRALEDTLGIGYTGAISA